MTHTMQVIRADGVVVHEERFADNEPQPTMLVLIAHLNGQPGTIRSVREASVTFGPEFARVAYSIIQSALIPTSGNLPRVEFWDFPSHEGETVELVDVCPLIQPEGAFLRYDVEHPFTGRALIIRINHEHHLVLTGTKDAYLVFYYDVIKAARDAAQKAADDAV